VKTKVKVPGVLELESLESLPCGCVAGAFRARPWQATVVSLEAKGPHCRRAEHQAGAVLGFGDAEELLGYELGEDFSQDTGYSTP
jgi:hypothetical protein